MNNKEIICYCSNVTRGDIITALKNGAKTFDDVREATGACTEGNCKELSPRGECCSPVIMQVMEEYEKNER